MQHELLEESNIGDLQGNPEGLPEDTTDEIPNKLLKKPYKNS